MRKEKAAGCNNIVKDEVRRVLLRMKGFNEAERDAKKKGSFLKP